MICDQGDLLQSGSAIISDDGLYRYELRRWWGPSRFAMFIGLNPSTADAKTNDPTIIRCCGFARRWGFDGIIMVNMYALRSTDPRKLRDSLDPMGKLNDMHLVTNAEKAGCIIACWGTPGGPTGARSMDPGSASVVEVLEGYSLQCLGRNKDGSPKHPLYLRNDTKLEPFECGGVN